MPFISYAQNYEDVILWRALRHVEKGFYVDVGASGGLSGFGLVGPFVSLPITSEAFGEISLVKTT
jgi:hypothetical protein